MARCPTRQHNRPGERPWFNRHFIPGQTSQEVFPHGSDEAASKECCRITAATSFSSSLPKRAVCAGAMMKGPKDRGVRCRVLAELDAHFAIANARHPWTPICWGNHAHSQTNRQHRLWRPLADDLPLRAMVAGSGNRREAFGSLLLTDWTLESAMALGKLTARNDSLHPSPNGRWREPTAA